MADLRCPKCNGPAVRVQQTSMLSCVGQCHERLPDTAKRIALEETTAALFRRIKAGMPVGVGFTLIMFNYGIDGSMAYASTAQRADMISTLREMADKLERDSGRAT